MPECNSDRQLIRSLCRLFGKDTQLIETHISWVLLSGDRARKIKKPLDLGFLDFSSLAKRRFYCREELRLNQRLAPQWYLDVVAIGGMPEQPRLRATEDIIEYLVEMRRFPESARLDHLLDRGALRAEWMDAFARRIAAFHQGLPGAPVDSPFGHADAVWAPMAQNFEQLREHPCEAPEWLDRIEQWSLAEFERLRDCLTQRQREGHVRECHGDLHLANMAWVDGQPLVFDCIEFDPALRWIDPINEVAFLLMDLHAREHPGLGWRFLDGWLAITGDFSGLALLRFYLVYRALVRAKVEAIRADQRDGAGAGVSRYLRVARDFIAEPRPRLILTRGLSASGKSTLSLRLVERLGAIRLRSDVERKRLFGLPVDASARAAPGEGIYGVDASDRVYARMLELAEPILAAGLSVIVDATFAKAEQRRPFARMAERLGVPWTLLQLEAGPDTLRRRIQQRRNDVSDADLDVLEVQLAHRRPLDASERPHCIRVDTERPIDIEALARSLRG